MQAFLIKASSFALCEMVSVLKAGNNPQSNRPGNLKGVAGFKNQAESYPDKCRGETRTSYTFNFNRLSNTKESFGIVVFVVYHAASVDQTLKRQQQ